MVTHDVDEALYLADRLILMTDGPEATVGDALRVPFPRPRTGQRCWPTRNITPAGDMSSTFSNITLTSRVPAPSMISAPEHVQQRRGRARFGLR